MGELFQKSALDSVAAPEQMDQQIKLVKPQMWLGIAALFILVVSAVLWGLFGTVNSTVSMKGIIFPKYGVRGICTDHDGNVQDVLYNIGDEVEKGDILAVIPNEEVLDQLETIQEQYNRAAGGEEKEALLKEMEQLQESYEKSSVIRAGETGVVQAIINRGGHVKTGDLVASVLVNSQHSNNRQVVAYVPLRVAKRLEIGMEAQICPSYVSREEYGYMEGFISSVGKVPVTEDMLLSYYGTMEYVRNILSDESCVEINISVQIDEESQNLFQWSNEKGRELSVEVGTICDVQTIVEQKHPIEQIFSI